MSRLESAADRRRKQHWHALGLPLVPRRDEPTGIFEDLSLGGPARGGFLLGGGGAVRLILRRLNPIPGSRPQGGTLVK